MQQRLLFWFRLGEAKKIVIEQRQKVLAKFSDGRSRVLSRRLSFVPG